MNKKFVLTLSILFALAFAFSANAAIFPNRDLIAPDSPFYFLQTWKESIQTFFTFGLENKAKQYLHLAEVRLDEYQKMMEKGKTDIAEKILEKYQKQLNHALDKVKEIQDKGKDVTDLNEKIEQAVSKHLEALRENLQKAPEQAKKGLENAIENSQKQIEKIGGKTCKDQCGDGICQEIVCMAIGCPCPETKATCPQDCKK